MAKIRVTLQRTYTASFEIDGINDDLLDSALRSAKHSHPEAYVAGRGEDLVWDGPVYKVKEVEPC